MSDTAETHLQKIPDAPAMQTFSNPLFGDLRGMLIDGRAWFVGTDVAALLGFDHAPHMFRMLDDDERETMTLRNAQGRFSFVTISEGGFYHCVFASKRQEAKAIRRWITDDVMPALLRTGSYSMHKPPAALPAGENTGATGNDVRLALIAEIKAAYQRGDISRKVYTGWLLEHTEKLLENTGEKPRHKKPYYTPVVERTLDAMREFATAHFSVTGDKADYIPLKELYAAYKGFTDVCGVEHCSQASFTRVLKQAVSGITVKQKKIQGEVIQIAAKCRWLSARDDTESTTYGSS